VVGSVTAPIKCPTCELLNPPETLSCACGYRFRTERLRDESLSTAPSADRTAAASFRRADVNKPIPDLTAATRELLKSENEAIFSRIRDALPPLTGEEDSAGQSTVEFLSEPRARDVDSIGETPFVTLIGAGIQNPFGPTLNALVVEGSFPFQPGSTVPFVHLMLNPYSQVIEEVAIARVGNTWNPFDEVPRFFSLNFGCCPTLLLPSRFLDRKANVKIYARFLNSFGDGPSNRWKASRIAKKLLKPKRVYKELWHLIFYWQGSIRNLKEHGAHEMADSAMPLSAFATLLHAIALSSDAPEPIPMAMAIEDMINSKPTWP